MGIKISLAGDLGSGKSTVSRILIEKLHAEYYSTGSICRRFATEHGLTVVEMNEYMETHPEFDKVIDDSLAALSHREDNLIIDSRMAFHFVRGCFRVYLSTEPEESARRIYADGRETESFATVEETLAQIRRRKESERRRYAALYGVDCKSLSNYDLVVDTTFATPEEIAQCILGCLVEWQEDPTRHFCYICPRRFRYPDDAPDFARADKLCTILQNEQDIGMVDALEEDGVFYLTGNVEVALAYSLNDVPLVPTRLHFGKPAGNFVRMADNL